jgi:hypothetical protein
MDYSDTLPGAMEAAHMPVILITDEARTYLEMISPGISQYMDYDGNDLWQADLDIDAVTTIEQNSLWGESPSDAIIRGVRTQLGIKPH